MKAAVMQGINKGINVEDLPEPVPAGDEIVIEQKQTGVCYRDILTYTGFFPRAKFPIVPGHEISGKIIATGPDVRNFKVGDRVATLIYVPCGICKDISVADSCLFLLYDNLVACRNWIEGSISSTRYDMISTLHLAEKGKIKHIGTAHFGLSEIEEAYSLIRSKNHTGRVFIDV